MTKECLYDVWRAVHHIPAWLNKTRERLGLTQEDEDFLVELDNLFLTVAKATEDGWRRSPVKRPDSESLAWAMERRKEYLEGELKRLKSELTDAQIQAGRYAMAGDEFAEYLSADRVQQISREMKRTVRALEGVAKVDTSGDRVTDAMIERAKGFPIAQIIGTDRNQLACPFHTDKHPSASIAKGFFYCFSCKRSLDAIGWLMQTQGASFIDAVRKLQ